MIYINNRRTGFWIGLHLKGYPFCFKVPLTTCEDFMELSVKQLLHYLSVCGLSTSRKKKGINGTSCCSHGAPIGYHRVN